ncbi:GntR family transcriptional regulator [Streptomyces sp900116325]|uniref:GntR family transcriptional regulator n=1 Tax=Streptomyces sp. 900116325 TaxID=3154295 RepID=UPI003327F9F0
MAREPGGGSPKYQRLADALRARIESGEFPVGSKLPTERALVEEYAPISQGTVRQAIAALRDEGLLESRVGSGVYVRSWRPIVRNALKRLSVEQWGEGRSVWDLDIEDRRVEPQDIQIEQLPASADIARALGIEEAAPVWRRNRRYAVDGALVLRSTAYIPDDLASGTRITQVDTGAGGTYARLADAGHAPASFREELRCRMPSAAEVADLELQPSTPVVELTRYASDASDRVVEVNRMILDASRYLLVYDFPA